MKKLIFVVTLFLSLLLFGCGGSGTETLGDTVTDGGTGAIVDEPVIDTPTDTPTPVSAILLTSNTSTINTNSSATITVTLFNASGQLIGSAKDVTFSLSNPALGSIPGTVEVTGGSTFQIFNARSTEGTVVITAKSESATATVSVEISDLAAASSIDIISEPATVTVGGTTVVKATVRDAAGDLMPSGTRVDFKVDNTSLGTVVSSATTDTAGVAEATFSASATNVGNATVTATSGSASNSTQIDVTGTDVASGSIEFFSADPQVIVIQGAGGQETSQIKFLVKDANGDPISSSKTVHLELSGPNGGEYIGSVSGVTTLDVGTVNGFATVILHSGTIPGTATITATVDGTALSTSSGVIAIGGGVPSAGHFSLSADVLNIEGLAYDNITDDILALIADRYGNYNVLQGTTVSFYSECGAIDRAVALDEIGQGSVTFRTQTPAPQDVAPGSCGIYCDIENQFISDFKFYLGVDIAAGSNNPRDGLCTIVAVVDGEEEFTDNNANGVYDAADSEPYVDTYDDIHLDMDDDETDVASVVAGNPYDGEFEDLVIDRDLDGQFDGLNGAWDRNKVTIQQKSS
ncbi:MAG: invasin domain 3-containing protein [Desulfuromonadales bacterium]|nr:invasin domain 3-containing protein [Desulfuromonadales bacterium]